MRIEQLLCENTASKNHTLNGFSWGNLKSLYGENKETLWDDLKAFYEGTYSADRLKITIQVKTEDDLAELRQWVTESFSIIEDKDFGFQNFSKQPKVDVAPEAQVIGTLPFQGNQDQLICMNTIQD